MRKRLLSTVAIAATVLQLNAQNVSIPDANFKAFLVGNSFINTNGDSEIQDGEASAYTGIINCANSNITDLTGIEAFVSLSVLNCSNNNLSAVDVSQNTALQSLTLASNSLTNLNVSNNLLLTLLKCDNNQLTSLDISNNTNLTNLEFYDNSITSLDLSQHPNIIAVYGYNNALTYVNIANGNNSSITNMSLVNNPSLQCIQVDAGFSPPPNGSGGWYKDAAASYSDVCGPCIVNIPDANFKAYLVGNVAINTNGNSEIECSEASAFTGSINCQNSNISDLTGIEAFTALTLLHCYSNNLSSLDVSQNTALTELAFGGNSINSIDLSQNTALVEVYGHTNNLTSLDVSQNTALTVLNCRYNNITSLDVSQNTALTELRCNNNNLISLNVANGNNSSITNMTANFNSGLTCIQHDAGYVPTNTWFKDASVSWSTNCGVPILVSSIAVQGQGTVSTITTAGGTLQMEATVLPTNADDMTYTWSVINGTGSATIDANGLLTAQTDGTVTVTATANDGSGVTGSAIITLSNQSILVNDISVQGQGGISSITSQGGTLQMEATVLPANADDMTFTWSVTNGTGSATISATGLLTAQTDGTVDVIATANDVSGVTGSATITISNQSVGINELSAEIVSIYPNPVENELFIEIKESSTSKISVFQPSGKIVKSLEGTNLNSILVSDLKIGLYILKVSTEQGEFTQRFIKR